MFNGGKDAEKKVVLVTELVWLNHEERRSSIVKSEKRQL